MKRPVPAVLCSVLVLLLTTTAASARWFSVRPRQAGLREIARSLAAGPNGEVKGDFRLTRDPESPAPPPREEQRRRSPVLTAEAAKTVAFAGPAVYTVLMEVGLDAANVKADALLPDIESIPIEGDTGREDAPARPATGDARDQESAFDDEGMPVRRPVPLLDDDAGVPRLPGRIEAPDEP